MEKKLLPGENMLIMELPGQELCTKYRWSCSDCFFLWLVTVNRPHGVYYRRNKRGTASQHTILVSSSKGAKMVQE